MRDNNRRIFALMAAIAAGLLLLSTAVTVLYVSWEKPPEVESVKSVSQTAPPAPTPQTMAEGKAISTEREDGVYTILLAGSDQGNGNTDTMMVVKLDTLHHSIDAVSIPRDTLINNAWTVRKLNSVYWGAEKGGGEGVEALRKNIKRLIGIEVDCYAVLDINALVEAVDTVGGIYYDVPMAMDYEDIEQELYIHLEPGYQLLNGEQVMQLCRYRSGYIDGDLGRISQQHDFLKAAAKQLISVGSIPNAPKLARLLSNKLTTDLTSANTAYFLRQLMLCDAENISFYTAPNDAETINGYSYAVLRLDEWLDMVNEHLNPFSTPITAADVDIVYKSGNSYAGTRPLADESYYNPPAYTPEPLPEPTARPNFSAPEE